MEVKESKDIELTISIPEDVLVSLKMGKEHLKECMQQTIALKYYKEKRLSLGKAASLANMNRLNFMDLLAKEGMVVFDYDEEDALDELNGVNKALQSIEAVRKMEGLGKEIWEGVDPDKYVEELRSEW